ncbi:MAG: hypothetical protein IPQ16_14065 [Geobacteraceae bacterium]|nr:hypothetical protein [Geobacteraceae bacterium]
MSVTGAVARRVPSVLKLAFWVVLPLVLTSRSTISAVVPVFGIDTEEDR